MKFFDAFVASVIMVGGANSSHAGDELRLPDHCIVGAPNISLAEFKEIAVSEYAKYLTVEQKKCVFDILNGNKVFFKNKIDKLNEKANQNYQFQKFVSCQKNNSATIIKTADRNIAQATEEICGKNPVK